MPEPITAIIYTIGVATLIITVILYLISFFLNEIRKDNRKKIIREKIELIELELYHLYRLDKQKQEAFNSSNYSSQFKTHEEILELSHQKFLLQEQLKNL